MRTNLVRVFKDPTADIGILLLASLAIVIPVYLWGIPFGNDLPQHYQFAQQFETAIREGTIYPSWAADVNSGYGDVGIRFYPPLAYYILAFFKLLAGDWYLGSVITFGFLFFVGSLGVYLWSRCFHDRPSSMVAALIYLLMPYHANQLYNAFLFAEFAGSAVLPFCFLFVTRLIRNGRLIDLAGLSISFAALILTHLPLTVIGSICLVVYSIALLEAGRRIRSIAMLAASVAVSLAATSFFWVRMVSEFSLVKVTGAEFTRNEFDFRANFLLSGLLGTGESYADRTLVFIDIILILSLAVAVTGGVLYLLKNRTLRPITPVLVLLSVALFFALPLSSPIWENVGPLARVQFPWRWMAVVSMAAALAAAAGVSKFVEIFRSTQRPVAIAVIGVAACFATFTLAQVIRPAIYTPQDGFLARVTELNTSGSCECLWPVWASKKALDQKEQAVTSNGRSVRTTQWTSTSRIFDVAAGPSGDLRISTFYYPYWKATVNGEPREINKGDSGEIIVPLDEAASNVEIAFHEPAYFRIAVVISAATWAVLLLFVISAFVRRPRSANDPLQSK